MGTGLNHSLISGLFFPFYHLAFFCDLYTGTRFLKNDSSLSCAPQIQVFEINQSPKNLLSHALPLCGQSPPPWEAGEASGGPGPGRWGTVGAASTGAMRLSPPRVARLRGAGAGLLAEEVAVGPS